MWKRVFSHLAFFCFLFLPSFAYSIQYTTSPTSFPGPGNNITFTVLKDNGDISPIDVLLVNTAGDGNVTTVIESFSPNSDNNLVVPVPRDVPPGQYLLRFVDHSTKRFILDSATFQLYATGTASSSSSPSASSRTAAPTVTTSTTSSSKKSNIGSIVGGIVGGIAVLAFVTVLLLCWRKRKHRAAGQPDIGNEKVLSPPNSASTQAAIIEPFNIAPRPRLPPIISTSAPNDTTSAFSSSVGLASSAATTGAVLSGKGGYLTHAYRPSTNTMDSSSMASPSSDVISSTPRPSPSSAAAPSTIGAGTNVEGTNELSAQIMRLQEQVRQIEARQGLGGGQEDFSVPPPVYDGPPAPPPAIPLSSQILDNGNATTTVPTINSSDVKLSLP